MTLVIIIGITLLLFGLAFWTKRRFGVLGLGLAAGVLLADTLSSNVSDFLEQNLIPVAPLSYDTAAIVVLTLLPSLLLMIGGPSYRDHRAALIGAVLFAVLGTLLILGPLTTDLPTLESGVRQVLDAIADWQHLIVAGGVALAVIDTMMVHGVKPLGIKRGRH